MGITYPISSFYGNSKYLWGLLEIGDVGRRRLFGVAQGTLS